MSYQSNLRRQNSRNFRARPSRSTPRNTNRNHKKYIDPALFVRAATVQKDEVPETQHSFTDFSLHEILQQNLKIKGYSSPSPVQDQTIPAALNGHDIIGVASTGTGKTAAFALPVLHKLISDKASKAIIVAPTRELAEQIEQEFRMLGKGSGIFGALLIGGTNMGGQLRDLRQRPQIIVGTPGRIKDHLTRGSLQLDRFNLVVLDEVDRMLDMGFVKDVTDILTKASPSRQSMFFSATINPKVRTLIDSFSSNPHTVSLKASTTSENVHQNVVTYNTNTDKIEKLHDLLLNAEASKVIVFDDTQRSVERLDKELSARGFSTRAIHGGKSQGQRKSALASFKNNDISILVATDVAARGIDVVDITHVINYSTPNDYEDYIHRIGRTGRAGRVGYALTFISR